MNYQSIIEKVAAQILAIENRGQVAQYIPELREVDPRFFGVHLHSLQGGHFGVGDDSVRFSIQSISKVFSLILAYNHLGADLWKRVGVEPSGTPFNSLVQLEYD